MTARWLDGDMVALDLETTGTDFETSRIVTACAIRCGPAGSTTVAKWLVDPGVQIPPEATAIHGITNEMAATGCKPDTAIRSLDAIIAVARTAGCPLAVMNANFDCSVLTNEAARLGMTMSFGPILDPRVIDLGCDVYRKGSRKLADLAKLYGVKSDADHTCEGDAITAARVVWRQAARFAIIADKTLDEMQDWQAMVYADWANNLTEYYKSKGKQEVVDSQWPVRRA